MIKAELGLDISNFQNGMKAAQKSVADVDKGGSMFGGITTTLGDVASIAQTAGRAIAAAFRGVYGAMEEGGALVDLAEQTGVSIERLSVLKVAFEQAGMAAGDVQSVVNKMQKAVAEAGTGAGPAALAFRDLGLNVKELGAMDAEAQLEAIGKAVNGVENPTKRAAMAMEIFGKSGGRLLAMFGAGGLAGAEKIVGSQAQLLADNAEIFDRTTDVLGQAGVKLRGLFVGIASELAPAAQEFVNEFERLDLVSVGKIFGDELKSSANEFASIIANILKNLDAKFGALKEASTLQTDIQKYEKMTLTAKTMPEGPQKEALLKQAEKFGTETGVKDLGMFDRFVGKSGILGTLFALSAGEERKKQPTPEPEVPKPSAPEFIGPMPESISDKLKRRFAAPFELPQKEAAPPGAIVSELARAGGGGNVFGGSQTSSALLDANRQQVSLLQRIASAVERGPELFSRSTTTPALGYQ